VSPSATQTLLSASKLTNTGTLTITSFNFKMPEGAYVGLRISLRRSASHHPHL
jgi:hypothetical protein